MSIYYTIYTICYVQDNPDILSGGCPDSPSLDIVDRRIAAIGGFGIFRSSWTTNNKE